MSINPSHPSQKQSLLAIVGVVIVVVFLVLLGNMYGRFLKTQVATPAQSYSASGAIKASVLQDPGTYTLSFHGQTQDARSLVDASTTFTVTALSTPIQTPTSTATIVPTSTPAPTFPPNLISQNLTVPTNLITGQALRFTANAKNTGTASAEPSKSAFCIDNTTTCKNSSTGRITGPGHDIPSLTAGQSSATFTSDPWTATVGAHTVTICSDVNNQVTESDENDNCMSATFTVVAQ